MSDQRDQDPGDITDAAPTPSGALPDADGEDTDGSIERVDISSAEGPELTGPGSDPGESVAPRPGHPGRE